jgi:hypothetical protein
MGGRLMDKTDIGIFITFIGFLMVITTIIANCSIELAATISMVTLFFGGSMHVGIMVVK